MLANFGAFENSLLGQFQHLQREIENSFLNKPQTLARRNVTGSGYPPVNIASSDKGFDIFVYISGLDAEGIEVSVKDSVLFVRAERTNTTEGNGVSRLQERRTGKISHSLVLADDVDSDSVEAKYNNGVLHISIARREEIKPRKITVQ